MKNKNLLIGGGVLAVILLFVYFRNRQNANGIDANGEDGMQTKDINSGSASGSGTSTTQPASQSATQTTKATPTTQLTKFELEARMLKSCGVRPLNAKGARRRLYNECLQREKAILRQQGLISFNGMDENSASGLDFDGNIID